MMPRLSTVIVGGVLAGAVGLLVLAVFVDFAMDPMNSRRRRTL